jgi:hypothetical protein
MCGEHEPRIGNICSRCGAGNELGRTSCAFCGEKCNELVTGWKTAAEDDLGGGESSLNLSDPGDKRRILY